MAGPAEVVSIGPAALGERRRRKHVAEASSQVTHRPVTISGRSSHQLSRCGWRIGARRYVLRPAATPILLVVPPFGAALVVLASRSDGLYRLLVREDALLEWAQVIAYLVVVATAATVAPRLWRHGDHVAASVVVGLGLVSLLSIGEELSWGQRLIGFTTPEIASQNRQGELTLHNDARIEPSTHLALLFAGLYGALAPVVVRRRTPLVPPRTLITFFAVIAVYYGVRVVYLDAPGYVEAKYSEWPETCFSLALLFWCAHAEAVARSADHAPSARPRGTFA
jgi:hypothetical protein